MDDAPLVQSTPSEPRPTWTVRPALPSASAAIGRRARAYLLDFQIVAGLMLAFLMLADWGAIPHRFGPSLIRAGMVVLVLYEPLLVRLLGGTLGHRLMGLRVVDLSGGRLSLPRTVLRTLIKWATIGYVGPLMVALRTRRAPWDVMVGSLVVDERLRRLSDVSVKGPQGATAPFVTIPRGDAAP